MSKVYILNKATAATTLVRPNRRGEISHATWLAALRRIGVSKYSEASAECNHVFICSAKTGKVLAVRFPAVVS